MNNDNNIERIIKMFEKSNVSKMELEVDNIKIKLEKNVNVIEEKQNTNTVNNTSGVSVNSPVVGTYYAQKSIDKPPFVSKGTEVKKGDVLCIIEAMKVMNEVTSPVDGKVLEIYAVNESLVEFDQTLFLIGE